MDDDKNDELDGDGTDEDKSNVNDYYEDYDVHDDNDEDENFNDNDDDKCNNADDYSGKDD